MWLMSHKRHKGFVGSPPRIEFKIGALTVADIEMRCDDGQWEFWLRWPDGGREPFKTCSAAMTRMHEVLKSPPPDDFQVGGKIFP